MNAYLLYHSDVETTVLPSGIIVYHDRSRHNQDPYIFNERFLQTYRHMSRLRKRCIQKGDLYFWVSTGEGVRRDKYTVLLCDLVFEVEQPDVEWSHPNNFTEDDPIVDSKQAWEDHYSWASIDHSYTPEQILAGKKRFTAKAHPLNSFQPVDQYQQRPDVLALLHSFQGDGDAKVDGQALYEAINYNAWGSAPFPLNHQVAHLLYQTLNSERFVQRRGKWLLQLRQDDDNAILLSSRVDRRKSTYRRLRRMGLDAVRKGV